LFKFAHKILGGGSGVWGAERLLQDVTSAARHWRCVTRHIRTFYSEPWQCSAT
jgi:hypothetical protein